MTFEIFVYRAQLFAVKLQQKKKGAFLLLQQGAGAMLTQFLMGLCFAKIMSEGEQQWLKRKSAKTANKK